MGIWEYLTWLVNWWSARIDAALSMARAYASWIARAIADSVVGQALNTVTGWINSRIAVVKTWALGKIQPIWDATKPARDWVKSAKVTVSELIKARTDPIMGGISEKAAELWLGIKSQAITTWNTVIAWTQPKIDWVKEKVDKVEAKTSAYDSFIKDQINLWSEDNQEKAALLFEDKWPTFSDFLLSPVMYILAILQEIFVDLFCYAIAYGLGTVKYSLPPWPKWFTPPSPGPGPPTPPVVEGLVAPLDHMYVSGYRFKAGHPATDYGCTYNCPIHACHSGIIEFVGVPSGGYGNCITIRGDEWWTRYAHLASFKVVVGQPVNAGQVIGGCDSTGMSTGNHLHLEIKYKGSFIDPETIFW